MNNHPVIKLFEDLLLPSPSGDEILVANVIRKKLDDLGFDHETDPAGNILVLLTGNNPEANHCVFAAHMDEIGMVVTKVDSDGKLYITRSGGLEPWKIGEGAVDIYGDEGTIQGVLSMGSTHTEDKKKVVAWNDAHIITGLIPEELKESGIRPGSPVLPTRERRGPVIFGPPNDPLIGAWTFDDRMGCATLLRFLETIKEFKIKPFYPTIIAFTTREEIGGHGAKFLVRTINPDTFISIDGNPIPEGAPLALDGRPGICAQDRIAQYDRGLILALSKAAREAGTELQPVVFDNAASDASLVSYSLGVPRIACVGHVRENSHGYEVARLSVFDNLLNTLVEFIKSFDQ